MALRRPAGLLFARLHVHVGIFGVVGFLGLGRLGLRRVGIHLDAGFRLVLLAALGLLVVGLLLVLVLVLGFLVGIRFRIFLHVLQQPPRRLGEGALVVEDVAQLADVVAHLGGEVVAPGIDHRLRGRGHGLAGHGLAHQQAHHLGEIVLLPRVDAGIALLPAMFLERGGEVLGDAGHALRADRLDPRGLDRIEDLAGERSPRALLAVGLDVVVLQLERDRIGLAAGAGDFVGRHVARGRGQPRLAAQEAGLPAAGRTGGEAHLDVIALADRADRRAGDAAKLIDRIFRSSHRAISASVAPWPRCPSGRCRSSAGSIPPPPAARARRICSGTRPGRRRRRR
jgi:hypothetical protein